MSVNAPVYLTKGKLEEFETELEYLTTTRRQEVAKMIAEAKAHGDLRENAGYDEAKSQQGFLEGRIRELENKLKHVQIIDGDKSSSEVAIGSTVIVEEDGTEFEEVYKIVGSDEADPSNGLISNVSPIGKALLGKRKGSKVKVNTPDGEIKFKIFQIE